MKIGIIGSGDVGQTLALGFLKLGHEVKVGTRDASKLQEWLAKAGEKASVGTTNEAAAFGELIVLCTNGVGTKNALEMAGLENFSGKIVIDVTNPLIFEEQGKPPKLSTAYPDSAGALIQKLLPDAFVVKAFNTVPAKYMTNPKLEEGEPDLFIAGNDSNAKKKVEEIARQWGWRNVNDLGDISQAYLVEALAMVWIVYGFKNNHWTHALKLLKK